MLRACNYYLLLLPILIIKPSWSWETSSGCNVHRFLEHSLNECIVPVNGWRWSPIAISFTAHAFPNTFVCLVTFHQSLIYKLWWINWHIIVSLRDQGINDGSIIVFYLFLHSIHYLRRCHNVIYLLTMNWTTTTVPMFLFLATFMNDLWSWSWLKLF